MNEIKVKAREFIDSNLIIDTLSHGPILWTDKFNKISDDMLDANVNPFKIVQDLVLEFANSVVSDAEYYVKYAEAWKESGVDCVSWTLGPIHQKAYSLEGVLHNYAYLSHMMDNKKEFFYKVLKAEDIENAYKNGKRAIILNFQDMQHIGTDLNLVNLFYMMGFRIHQLTYNTKNAVGTGCTARVDKGLTEFGISVVERINQLGGIVDVSHCGLQTSKDAIEHSKDPIIASHSFSRNFYEHDRGKTDDILQSIAEKGGYIGILTVAGFLSNKPQPTIDDWLDHVDYVVNLVGIDSVGIGTDYFGYSLPDRLAEKVDELMLQLGFREEHRAFFTLKLQGFENYMKFPALIEGLIQRGYSDQELKKLCGLNFLRVFKKIVG
jgi:membrane dipeptidase